jgi:thioredoxin-like negative regulator of GroEL
MLERLILAGIIVVVGTGAWILYNRLTVKRLAITTPNDPLLTQVRAGVPTIVYFTTPMCQPCRTLQRPALDRLEAELGPNIQVIQVDSCEQPEVADRWGVFSAPTTVVLDRDQRPRQVNRGVASTETLMKQLQTIA